MFAVPVLCRLVRGGAGNNDPDLPPELTITGSRWDYADSLASGIVDEMETLERQYPEVFDYFKENDFAFEPQCELVFIEEFRQWNIVLSLHFASAGEGIIFAMWHASEHKSWHPMRERMRRR